MAYATTDDVSVMLGRELTEAETALVAGRLDHAEAIIAERIPDLTEKVVSNARYGRLLVMVEVDAVLRVIRNPEEYRGETDGNYSYQLSPLVASGRLEILPNEWQTLGVNTGVSVIVPRLNVPGREEPRTEDDEAVWG